MWRRNIHSLLTLAAEPSEPDVGAAEQPRGWPVSRGQVAGLLRPELKRKAQVIHTAPTRKERAAGMVPAFTL